MKTHVFRSLPLSADSRTLRNCNIFINDATQCYSFEKDKEAIHDSNAFPLTKGGRRISRVFKYILFILWIPYILLKKVQKGDVAIFMDLETAILGVPFAKFKKVQAVFDIVDPFAQTKVKWVFLQKLFDHIELAVAELADVVVIPHSCRIDYYRSRLGYVPRTSTLLIVENVPFFREKSVSGCRDLTKLPRKRVIGYFGSLDSGKRGLEWLLAFVQRYSKQYELIVAGQGSLSQDIIQLAAVSDNIKFHGPFKSTDLLNLYDSIDFVWAYYSANVCLHHFAAPNKYYEHLFFGKPIITSVIIPQWHIIESLGTGISVNCESNIDKEYIDLHEKLKHYSLDSFLSVRTDTKRFWEENYTDYYEKILRQIRNNTDIIRKHND